MTVGRLIAREIGYRRLNFALAALAVLVAVALATAILTLVKGYRLRAEALAEVQAARAGEVGFRLTDDARRLMLELGYNVLILDEQEDRAEFLSTHQPTRLMDEAVVERLAQSRKLVVKHLLPTLQQRLRWPEKDLPIVLVGTRGEVPLSHFDPKKPMIAAVPEGGLVAGSLVAERAGLAVGRTVTLLGQEFRVSLLHERRGNDDDITVWVPLADAQRLLDRPGKIHAILALGCLCVEQSPDKRYHVRELHSAEELERLIREVVPTVQVIVLERAAAIRRATRAAAGQRAREFLDVEEAGRASRRAEREALAAWVIPLAVLGGVVWVGLMALGNVRARRPEIGILRALGVGARKMAAIILGRAVLVGLVGAILGYAVGFALAVAWDAREAGHGALAAGPAGLAALFGPGLLAGVLVLAPVLSAAASLVPALLAAQQDPAVILREE
jgi:hypothetical protein